jgi:hypothetical protein
MKRQQFIRELEQAGCVFGRDGAKHDIDRDTANGREAPILSHLEIRESLCRLIKKQLGLISGG